MWRKPRRDWRVIQGGRDAPQRAPRRRPRFRLPGVGSLRRFARRWRTLLWVALIVAAALQAVGLIGLHRVLDGTPPAAWAPRNCAEARALGIAPIHRGQPGYAPHLDWDNDGIACEPWPHWRR